MKTKLRSKEKAEICFQSLSKSDWKDIRKFVKEGNGFKVLEIIRIAKDYNNLSSFRGSYFIGYIIDNIDCYLKAEEINDNIPIPRPCYSPTIIPIFREILMD